MAHPRPARAALLAVAAVCAVAGADRPAADAEKLAAALARTRAAATRDDGVLWGRSLATVPFLFVDGEQALLSADPRQPGYTRRGPLWVGPRPAQLTPANTSVTWAGRRWAMVLLPLPTDDVEATRLLLHEAFHVLQPEVLPLPPFAETPAGAALLDEPDGRIWLQLEWRALTAALTASPRDQDVAVERALLCRGWRLHLASTEEQTRERLLDEAEGLAEYTAWRLTATPPAELATAIARDAPRRPSFVRAFPYFTGPAYGLLLDTRRPGWRRALPERHDLAALLAETLPPARRLSAETLEVRARAAGAALGLVELHAAEKERWRARQERLAELRRRFVAGPVLRLQPGSLRISFDPRDQVSLGADGTIMASVEWRGDDGGALEAPGGALVSDDWRELRLPLPPSSDAAALPGVRGAAGWTLRGPGWTLTLPPAWQLIRAGDASWLARPPRRR